MEMRDQSESNYILVNGSLSVITKCSVVAQSAVHLSLYNTSTFAFFWGKILLK